MALINAYRRRIKRVNSQPLNEHKSRGDRHPQPTDREATPTNQSTSPKQPTPPHPSCCSAVTFPSNEIKTDNNETQSGSQAISMRAFVVDLSACRDVYPCNYYKLINRFTALPHCHPHSTPNFHTPLLHATTMNDTLENRNFPN
ncbi:LOW QUALITY PROTEIN: uncharacterized protein LOC117893583 [Drosophila subobscura]|uniref:LOW QUALITY PROTEIN: uncharacterized protein LOC117893583 n=1 Tax=Drosophila subobscura TaxID=7241 RepID=UPI00155A1CF7|nr:LOW QUALITY PROTEIN: uncharacterized protein LOC117893583 [Drosophila subobscura]